MIRNFLLFASLFHKKFVDIYGNVIVYGLPLINIDKKG